MMDNKAHVERWMRGIQAKSAKPTVRDLIRETVRDLIRDARRAERERCTKVCDAEAEMWMNKEPTGPQAEQRFMARAGAVTRAAELIRALPDHIEDNLGMVPEGETK